MLPCDGGGCKHSAYRHAVRSISRVELSCRKPRFRTLGAAHVPDTRTYLLPLTTAMQQIVASATFQYFNRIMRTMIVQYVSTLLLSSSPGPTLTLPSLLHSRNLIQPVQNAPADVLKSTEGYTPPLSCGTLAGFHLQPFTYVP